MELKYFIRKNDWLSEVDHDRGYGNGYIFLPPTHSQHNKEYDEIQVDVHGGLTFSMMVKHLTKWKKNLRFKLFLFENRITDDFQCIGFDTSHYGDNLIKWDKENVEKETIRLKEQLEKMK